MIAAWGDYRRIWRVATVPPKRQPALIACIIVGLALGASAVGAALHHRWDWATRLLGAIGLYWLLFSWIVFMTRSLQMNSPANARLLPRQRRRLVQMALAGWLALTFGAAALSGMWRLFPLLAIFVLSLGLIVVSKFAIVIIFAMPPVIGAAAGGALLSSLPLPDAIVALLASPPAVLAASGAVLLLGARRMAAVYPDGGDRHAEARVRIPQPLSGGDDPQRAARRSKGWLSGAFYLAALKRDCRTPRPGAMLMHALGPQAHWTAWIAVVAGLAVLCLATRLAIHAAHRWFGMEFGQGFLMGTSAVGMLTMTVLVAFSSAHFSRQLRITRGEQTLLRLTPLAGASTLFNRRLAAALLKTGLVNWTMASAALLLLALLLHANGRVLVCLAALCCVMGQVVMARLLGDFSRASKPGLPVTSIFLALLLAAEALVAWALARVGGWSLFWAGLGLLGLAGSGVLAVRGWSIMLAAPPAFPAGRIE